MKLIDLIVIVLIIIAVYAAIKTYRKKPSCCHDGGCNHVCSSCHKKCKK